MQHARTPTTTPSSSTDPAAAAVAALLQRPDRLDPRDLAFLTRLAGVPHEAWGPGVTRAACDLAAAHCDLAATSLVAPDTPPDRHVRALWAEHGHFLLAFSFDEQLHADVRALPERHYDPKRKRWSIPATQDSAHALTRLAARHRLHATRETTDLLAAAAAGHAHAPLRRIEHVDGQWRIVLPPPSNPADWSLLRDVRALPGRRFHAETPDTPAHWTLDDDADALAQLVDLVDVHGGRLYLTDDDRARLAAERARALDASANVTLGPDGFELTFDYDPAIVAQIQAISGREFDRARRVWTIPRAVGPALQLATVLATTGLTINDEAAHALHDLRLEADRRAEQQIHLVDLSQALDADLQLPDGFAVNLHPFQRAGVQYILSARRTFVADSQGLGKTVQCLAGVHADQAFPALVVTTATMKLTWRDEAQRALPARRSVVIGGETPDPEQLDGADIVIVNYDVLNAWLKTLRKVPWKAIVGDEGHVLKEPGRMKAKQLHGPARSFAFARLAAAVTRRGGLVLLATATPIVNRPRDLVNGLRILDKLREFGGSQGFKQRYCDPEPTEHGTRYDGASNLEELNVRLRACCLVRRHKRDVLQDLPAKQRTLVRLELSESDRRRYDRAHADVVAFLRAERAQQAHMSLLDQADTLEHDPAAAAERAPALVRLNTLRKLVAKAKLAQAIDWTRTFLASDEKLILFARHREIQTALIDRFPDCARIIADDSIEAVERHKARFQNDPDCQLIVCSLEAGSEGHTLTAASNCAFVELDWTARRIDQAEDRGYGRLNDAHGMNCWYLLADATVDITMAECIERKRQVAARALDGDRGAELAGDSILEQVIDALLET